MPEYVNLTRHQLDMVQPDGSVLAIPTSGVVCRITESLGSHRPDADGIWTIVLPDEEPAGLPDEEEGVYFVVPRDVAVAMAFAGQERRDVLVVRDIVRNGNEVIGARGFARII